MTYRTMNEPALSTNLNVITLCSVSVVGDKIY